jgi:excinuclease ABC subunit C
VKELLAHFRSIDAIQLATPEQLAAAPGVGAALARQVWDYFHADPVLENEAVAGELAS